MRLPAPGNPRRSAQNFRKLPHHHCLRPPAAYFPLQTSLLFSEAHSLCTADHSPAFPFRAWEQLSWLQASGCSKRGRGQVGRSLSKSGRCDCSKHRFASAHDDAAKHRECRAVCRSDDFGARTFPGSRKARGHSGNGLDERRAAQSAVIVLNFCTFNLKAILKAAQQRGAASKALDRRQ